MSRATQQFAILGSGICGLTVGNLLLDKYPEARVTIYSDGAEGIVSTVAGAQFYPIWLGENMPAGYEDRLRSWYLTSKRIFEADGEERGVRFARNHELFKQIPQLPKYFYDILPNIETVEDPTLPLGYTHRFSFDTMMISPLIYLPLLTREFAQKGGVFVKRRFNALDDVLKLHEPVIFNCLGMGSKTLFGDPYINPVKGVMIRMKPISGLNVAVSADDLIMAPRTEDVYLGCYWGEKWDTEEITKDEFDYVFEGNKKLLETPGSIFSQPKDTLKRENVIESHAGFRPVRDIGPRVEKETIGQKTIIHNYGHGGNGIVLSWGTGTEAVELAS